MNGLTKYNNKKYNFQGTNYQVPWKDIAHQGLGSSTIPFNTLPAFYTAYLDGAKGVEFDVRQTTDGELIISHDASIKGTVIASSTWETIKKITLATDTKYGDIRVPTLDETLNFFQFYNMIPIIHVYIDDTEGLEKVAKTVLHHNLSGKCMYNTNSYSDVSIIEKAQKIINIDKKASFQMAYDSTLSSTTYNSITENNSQIVITIYANGSDINQNTVNTVKEMGYDTYIWSLYSIPKIYEIYSYCPNYIEYGDNIYVSNIRESYLNNLDIIK